jgi:hypothetical protein
MGVNLNYKRLSLDIGYVKIEPNSLIGYYTSWGNQVNSCGWRDKIKYKLTSSNSLVICYNNFHKENSNFAGPFQRDRRIMVVDMVKF